MVLGGIMAAKYWAQVDDLTGNQIPLVPSQ